MRASSVCQLCVVLDSNLRQSKDKSLHEKPLCSMPTSFVRLHALVGRILHSMTPEGRWGHVFNTKPTHRSSEGNSLSLVSGYVCNFGDLYSGHIADAAVLCSCCEAGVAGLAVVVFISGGRPKLASDTHPASRTSEHA